MKFQELSIPSSRVYNNIYNTFNPGAYAAAGDLIGHYEPQLSNITLQSGNVRSWANSISGTASTLFAQNAAGLQPLYIRNGQAGLPSMLFDGVDDVMVANGTTSFLTDFINTTSNNEATWLAVLSVVSISSDSTSSFANNQIVGDLGGYFSPKLRNIGGTTPVVFGGAFGADDRYVVSGSEFGITYNTPFLVTMRKKSGTIFVSKNQQPEISLSAGTAPSQITNTIYIGQGNGVNNYTNMNLSLLLFYKNGNITNLSGLQENIMRRWSLT